MKFSTWAWLTWWRLLYFVNVLRNYPLLWNSFWMFQWSDIKVFGSNFCNYFISTFFADDLKFRTNLPHCVCSTKVINDSIKTTDYGGSCKGYNLGLISLLCHFDIFYFCWFFYIILIPKLTVISGNKDDFQLSL
jgi:hypothetical protein